jgi:hypothetical protein
VRSEATAVIASAPSSPELVMEPSVSGEPLEGDLLTADEGTWIGTEPISYTYQFFGLCISPRMCHEYMVEKWQEVEFHWRSDVQFEVMLICRARCCHSQLVSRRTSCETSRLASRSDDYCGLEFPRFGGHG